MAETRFFRLDQAALATRLPNGLELQTAKGKLQVVALNAGILRICFRPDETPVPLASWAVLPGIMHSSIGVTHDMESGCGTVRFTTPSLDVTVTLDPLHLRIADPFGNVLLEDAPGRPVEFTGTEFHAWKSSPPETHYYGLGDKPGRLDRRGRAVRLWNTDDPSWRESDDLLYKAVPFVVGLCRGRAWGLLFDNTWRSVFDFGVAVSDTFAFGAEAGLLNYYVLCGPDPKDVLRRYAELTGAAPLPPLWSLGFHQSRYSYPTAERVQEIARQHRERRIPLDAIWLDIGYQDRNRPFTVDTEAFPDLRGMVGQLQATGVQTVAITDLHIAHQPQANYPPYQTGHAGDHFLRRNDGSEFVGESWPGAAVFPEFAREDTRQWWGELYHDFYLRDGIAGFWNDMNEPSVRNGPGKTMALDVQHRIADGNQPARVATHAEMHNVYGLQNTKATHEGLLRLDPDRRPFVLTRASYAGGHRYAATWTGDNASTWQHLRLSVPQLLNLGLSGFTWSGSDVGGFGGSPSPDLLTRWMQLGAFTPFFRNHTAIGTADQESWVHGPAHEVIRRHAVETRYRLMPYLYTLAEEASRTGLPIMRPMFLEFPGCDLETEDSQFMFGPSLLVAPWPDETTDPYQLILPPGDTWYDYWTGRPVDASKDILIEKRLDLLPVFARAGAIVPHQPLVQSTSEAPDGVLLLQVYPGPECQGTIYVDDGKSFAYQKGEFLRQPFACRVAAGRVELSLSPPEGNSHPWWRAIEVWVHGMDRPAASVAVNGQTVDRAWFNQARGAMGFRFQTTTHPAQS